MRSPSLDSRRERIWDTEPIFPGEGFVGTHKEDQLWWW